MLTKPVQVPADVHRALKAAAALRGTTAQELVAETLRRDQVIERQLQAMTQPREVRR